MKTVTVYHDGKLGRGTPGTVIKNKGKRLLISFELEPGEPIENWFVKVRRENRGAFCDHLTNHWFYPVREKTQ